MTVKYSEKIPLNIYLKVKEEKYWKLSMELYIIYIVGILVSLTDFMKLFMLIIIQL